MGATCEGCPIAGHRFEGGPLCCKCAACGARSGQPCEHCAALRNVMGNSEGISQKPASAASRLRGE